MSEKLLYNGQKVLSIRDFNMGGKSMCEIKIMVPRSEIHYEDEIKNEVNEVQKEVPSKSQDYTVIVEKLKDNAYQVELSDKDLAQFIKDNNLNPNMVQNVLKKVTKSHKGFTFRKK